jgi:hypothetical protein
VDYGGNRHGLDFYFSSATQVIAANTWYNIEIEDNQTTAGKAEVWNRATSQKYSDHLKSGDRVVDSSGGFSFSCADLSLLKMVEFSALCRLLVLSNSIFACCLIPID